MQNELQSIEELRRRAKDNKALNASFYLSHSFNILNSLRTTLITLSAAGIALIENNYLQSDNSYNPLLLYISIIFGILSYISSWKKTDYEAHYYANVESIFYEAYPSKERYEKMINQENDIKKAKNNFYIILDLVFLTIQIVFLLIVIGIIAL